jgi:hypothetical protein
MVAVQNLKGEIIQLILSRKRGGVFIRLLGVNGYVYDTGLLSSSSSYFLFIVEFQWFFIALSVL